jgi:hypothetical protein
MSETQRAFLQAIRRLVKRSNLDEKGSEDNRARLYPIQCSGALFLESLTVVEWWYEKVRGGQKKEKNMAAIPHR